MSRYGSTGITSWNSTAMGSTLRARSLAVLNERRLDRGGSDVPGCHPGERLELAVHVRLIRVAGSGRDGGEWTGRVELPQSPPEPGEPHHGPGRETDLRDEPLHEVGPGPADLVCHRRDGRPPDRSAEIPRDGYLRRQ